MSAWSSTADHVADQIDHTTNGVTWLALLGGGAILVGRPLVGSDPQGPTVLLLAYTALIALSLTPSMPRDWAAPLAAPLAVAAGVAVVVAVGLNVGPPIPLVVSAWALPLNLVAAVAEEAFFRRLLYGGLRRWGPVIAVAGSAVAFALVHVPFYGPAPFWVNLGAGLLLGWQRWASGGWGAPAITHGVANVLAVLR